MGHHTSPTYMCNNRTHWPLKTHEEAPRSYRCALQLGLLVTNRFLGISTHDDDRGSLTARPAEPRKNLLNTSTGGKLDAFISYRRSNGSQLASLLKVHLELRGYRVFLDIERLTAGRFDLGLINSIVMAKNFILVLTPNALDRCLSDKDGSDWVHKEIICALENRCNIIPLTDRFDWPAAEDIPEDIRSVIKYNSVK
ncbi:unnamed protein product [Schistocephalus solidus]|uniref:TIR domain-containing protein n=1 Tax=Schistocephalus solidus TaxID=70667 RepID=A0A183STI7_SCHSO|nr:unnamed protein product [Schistocephalus solidus]